MDLFDRGLNPDLSPASREQARSRLAVTGIGASFQNQSGSSNASPAAIGSAVAGTFAAKLQSTRKTRDYYRRDAWTSDWVFARCSLGGPLLPGQRLV